MQEQYFLTKQKTLLDLEQQRIVDLNFSLHNRQVELDSLCDKRASQKPVQLVAYCPDDCLEMDKDWNLMSELDKDALIRKKIIREL